MTWSGQVSYYQYYLPKGQEITQYSYVWPAATNPDLQGILTNDVFAIPKGAANPVLAHAMIDFLLEPENAHHELQLRGVPASDRAVRQ